MLAVLLYSGICNSRSGVPNWDILENVGIVGNNKVSPSGDPFDIQSVIFVISSIVSIFSKAYSFVFI